MALVRWFGMRKSFALGVLLSFAGTASAETVLREKVLLVCRTQKWTEVRLREVTADNDPKTKFYELSLRDTSRERESVGNFTERIIPVFATGERPFLDASHQNARTQWRDLADGGFELIAEYHGTQPPNTSKLTLSGKPGQYDGEKGLYLSLKPGASSTGQNFAYDFFSKRWGLLRKAADGASPAIREDQKDLFCVRHQPAAKP